MSYELPRVWGWRIWDSGGGLPEDRALDAFGGGIPINEKGKDGKYYKLNREHNNFARAFDAFVRGSWGSDKTARDGFPSYYPRMVAKRALLLQAQDRTWFPIATVGPEGWLALTEEDAIRAVRIVAPDGGAGPKGQTALDQALKEGGVAAPGTDLGTTPPTTSTPPTPKEVELALTQDGMRPGGGFADESMGTKNEAGEGPLVKIKDTGSALGKQAVGAAGAIGIGVLLRLAAQWIADKFTGGSSTADVDA